MTSRLALALIASAAIVSCGGRPEDAREAQITAVIAAADESAIRTRPRLVEGKYTRMAEGVFDFYRGSLPIFRHDMRSGASELAVSRFGLDVPLVPSLGDPHPENFGALRAADGTLAVEPNDFDAADHAPYLWDVRRLCAGTALAAMVANAGAAAAEHRIVARAAAAGYRAAIEQAALGRPLPRVDGAVASESPILAEVLRRSDRDHATRRELADLTVLEGGVRRLRRGVIDPEDPQNVYVDLPPSVASTLPEVLAEYRRTLVAPPPPEHLMVLDAVRELGSGVASWPRIRVIVLVRGPSDAPEDDLVLELKELVDSGIAGLYPPGLHHDDVGARVRETSRSAWARPDAEPWWGTTTFAGVPCQIRLESEGQKNVRVARMVDELGTPAAIADLARVLGGLVARVHVSGEGGTERARAIYGRIATDPDGFLEEQADAGAAYARLVALDHARFVRALHRHGLRLGVPIDPDDAPRPDLAALLGAPPPPPPLPPPPP